jgi:uncharacterized protein (TIGR02147 family)
MIFSILSYKEFLAQKLSSPDAGRGAHAAMAKAAGCQSAYLSQVLHSKVQLTPDHAFALCNWWRLDADETSYFMNLVHLERAAKPELRSYYEQALEEMRRKKADLAGRFQKAEKLESVHATKYYSDWLYAVLHVMVGTLPHLDRDPHLKETARRLGLAEETVLKALQELKYMGVLTRTEKGWHSLNADLHLPKGSPLQYMNHVLWRLKSVDAARSQKDQSLHFSAVYSLSAQDAQKIRELVVRLIEESRQIVAKSPEEKVVAMLCDYFYL